MLVGGIEVIEQKGLTKMPQKAASAWAAFDEVIEQKNLTKMPQKAASAWAAYKPIAYVGTQIVKGVNHVFLAEQTLVTAPPVRHIVIVKINEFGGDYTTVGIEQVI